MFVPLSDFLISPRPGAEAVAILPDGTVKHFADLHAETADLAARIKAAGARRLVLACESGYGFVCGMLAAFQVGCHLIVPPNALPGVLAQFVAPDCSLLSDIPGAGGAAQIVIDGRRGQEFAFHSLDSARCLFDFYTSGSTGEPKRVPKSLKQIEDELIILDRCFGDRLSGTATLGTVSHQHIFGLYFKCLLPLCEGRAFYAGIFEIWEELLAAAPRRASLVTSPAHLTRIPPLDPLPEAAQMPIIFTAGGPLPFAAARHAARLFGPLPTEIFGSTETGAIAFRRQEAETTPFRPLPGAETRSGPGGVLEVRSAYTTGGAWEAMNDLVTRFDDGSFLLTGRASQFVKIEGKRLSLAEIEMHLNASRLVREAAVFILPGSRDILAAVAELSPAGWRRHDEIGPFRLGRELRKELAPHLENAALPRRWRFVAALPLTAQGKRQQQALHELFAETDEGA
ncbi:AMP-binding protein [Sneathiella sp.]|uniref:AMP-binding protein n=1 Tax=Sneathiella sp. TaxID=1964365 RepID=UPI002FE3592F